MSEQEKRAALIRDPKLTREETEALLVTRRGDALLISAQSKLRAALSAPQEEDGRRWSAEYQQRFDAMVTDLIRAIREEFPDGHVEAHWLEEGSGGSVNGRGALGTILRTAIKHGLVSVSPDQARKLAHSGSASHDDTAADLLAASTQQSEGEGKGSGVEAAIKVFDQKRREAEQIGGDPVAASYLREVVLPTLKELR